MSHCRSREQQKHFSAVKIVTQFTSAYASDSVFCWALGKEVLGEEESDWDIVRITKGQTGIPVQWISNLDHHRQGEFFSLVKHGSWPKEKEW